MTKYSDYSGEALTSSDESYPDLCLFARQHTGNKKRFGAGRRQAETIFIEGGYGDVKQLADPYVVC